MKAVMYGGGNIGRGFIGMLFSQAGCDVTFVDVVDEVVDHLHNEHKYPVRIISNEGYRDVDVLNVDAVNGNDTEAVAEAIAECDIMATAVGAKILKFIAPNIAAGLKKRFAKSDTPLDIIVCENLMDADKVLKGLVCESMNDEEKDLTDKRVGFVEASIGRMVPVQTPEMKDGEPMRVCVEGYAYLPVDKAAFKGELPAIDTLVPFTPFDFYIKRKLFLHNMGHSVCAYLGGYSGYEYIYEAIDDPEILCITQNAMLESAMALAKKYDVPLGDIVLHVTDLLNRFRNAALKDTCQRVGGDPERKLQPADRLIGASLTVIGQGSFPAFTAVGIAGAIYRFINENEELPQSADSAKKILTEICRLEECCDLYKYVMELYGKYLDGCSISDLRRLAEDKRGKGLPEIV